MTGDGDSIQAASAVDAQMLAEEFCRWPLPEGTCADQCASDAQYAYPRSGTNLLTVDQAKRFFDYCFEKGLLSSDGGDTSVPSGASDKQRQMQITYEAGDRVRWYHPPLCQGTVLKNNGGMVKVRWDTGITRRDVPEKLVLLVERVASAPIVHGVDCLKLLSELRDQWRRDGYDNSASAIDMAIAYIRAPREPAPGDHS